jgi:hypothetical protein
VVVACAVPLGRRDNAACRDSLTLTALTVVGGTLAFGGIIGYAAKALVQTVPQLRDRLSISCTTGPRLDARGIDASS